MQQVVQSTLINVEQKIGHQRMMSYYTMEYVHCTVNVFDGKLCIHIFFCFFDLFRPLSTFFDLFQIFVFTYYSVSSVNLKDVNYTSRFILHTMYNMYNKYLQCIVSNQYTYALCVILSFISCSIRWGLFHLLSKSTVCSDFT